MCCRLEDFCEGRMGVDYILELIKSCLSCHQSACFLDYVRSMRAVQVAAKKLTGLDLRQFDHAIVFKVALMVRKYLSSRENR